MKLILTVATAILLPASLWAQSRIPVPARIFVQGKWYRVYVDSHSPEDIASGAGKWGSCDCKQAYIQIEPNQTDAQKRDTLWHEINHAKSWYH